MGINAPCLQCFDNKLKGKWQDIPCKHCKREEKTQRYIFSACIAVTVVAIVIMMLIIIIKWYS